MQNHNGYWKENGCYYVLNYNGLIISIAPHKIAQLEMLRKGES